MFTRHTIRWICNIYIWSFFQANFGFMIDILRILLTQLQSHPNEPSNYRYVTHHYITLYYIILHYITLYYIILHYITLYYIILHYIADWYDIFVYQVACIWYGGVISLFIIYQCYVYRTNIRHIPPEVAWECDTTSVIRRVWYDECDTMQTLWGKKYENLFWFNFVFEQKKEEKNIWLFF